MRSFVDEAGRTWNVHLSCGALRRVLTVAKVNLVDPPEKGQQPPYILLLQNPIRFCEVMYAVLQPAATAAGLDEDAFYEVMAGKTLGDAYDRFFEELDDFFRCQGRVGDAAAVAKARTAVLRLWQAQRERVEAVNLDLVTSLLAESGEPSTDSPASLELTPTT